MVMNSDRAAVTVVHLVIVSFIVLVCSSVVIDGSSVYVSAKLVARGKAYGRGHSEHATSLGQCLALCNKKPEFCDALNYHVRTGKCRLLRRCTPITVSSNSTYYYYYSKRPQIVSDGFVFEAESESCLKVIEIQNDYERADAMCEQQNGRLAALTTPALNSLATALLKSSGAQYAWIGLRDAGVEGNPTHSDGSRVRDHGFFRPAPQHWRNSTTNNCWALQDQGQWAELSCKRRHLFSICEVPAF